MALKDTLAKLNEIDFNEIDLNDIDFSSAGLWPAPVKALIGVAVFIGVLLLGYFFLVTDLQTDLDRVVKEEGLLKTEFKEKYRQAVHLEAYRRQALEMEESFKQILSQLPSDTEIPGLIEDISKVGVSNGLVFNKIDAYTFISKDDDDLTPIIRKNLSLKDLKKTWLSKIESNAMFISALNKTHFDDFKVEIYNRIKQLHEIRYPYNNFLY